MKIGSAEACPDRRRLILELAGLLLERNWTCATAESCTGGLIGAELTKIPGSSRWYRGGVIVYSNASKAVLLDVPPEDLAGFGAVSEPVARQMAAGVRRRLGSDVSLSVTGVAGPDGGSPDKPVGTVWLGWHGREEACAEKRLFYGSRHAIRMQAVSAAIQGLVLRLR